MKLFLGLNFIRVAARSDRRVFSTSSSHQN